MRWYYLIIFLLLAVLSYRFYHQKTNSARYESKKKRHHYVIQQAHKLIEFDLVDPEQAPEDIRDQVMHGYNIILNTPFYAPEYAKDQLSCTHCHFCGGDTLGGRNSGISLVGVTNIYPQYSERNKKTITLAERINNCFQRSMSGNPAPLDSDIMKDVLAYLDWISKEVKKVKDPPWLGLKFLKSKHKPNSKNGEIIYQTYCAACHKDDGAGGGTLPEPEGKTIPPLWGANSFNDGAGMNTIGMLSSFIYWNMPYQNSVLTEEEALDVAEFIRKQPRPHFQ